jgi:mono/diheme cytochrome c family protein
MRTRQFLLLAGLGCVLAFPVLAANTSALAQLERFSAEAGRAGQADAGRQFFLKKHGQPWACASCHGELPTGNGRHASTGKVLEPLAPAFNPQSLSDVARVDKWFRRNCKDVLGRECSAGEKADVLAWLIGLK